MILTLLTDFGRADHFVAAMKGIILQTDPRIRFVDISHEVPPHDVETAAFLLFACYRDFPPGTVHLAVVDPGVGSSRHPIVVSAGQHRFVGPDNGIFSHVLDEEPTAEVRIIENPALPRAALSSTFHGRDLFAPTAAALACGFPRHDIGRSLAEPVRLETGIARSRKGEARVVHVDRFGNCVTSLRRVDVTEGALRLEVGGTEIDEIRESYAAGAGAGPFGIWGSTGLLELSVAGGSAAAKLGIRRGDRIVVKRS